MDPIETLKKYTSFPSVSADSNYSEGMIGAQSFIGKQLEDLGFEVEMVSTPKHPIVLGRRIGNKEWPHIVIYGHYDVQPADPFELWTDDPFEATLRGDRLYGRGTADNKGPQIVHMAALANVFKEHPDLPLNITYLIEGEEEIGSPSFQGFLEDYKDELSQADMILVSDTGIPNTDQPVITTGLRGLVAFEVELTGPKVDLHSGIHGGCLLNPLQALTKICASLHEDDFSVNVDGFYEDVLEPTDWEKNELKKLPVSEDEYKQFLGVDSFAPKKGLSPLEAVRFGPTLEFNGLGGGYQGEGSKTVIPSKAFAKITCRLVPDQKPEDIYKKVKKAIEDRCPSQIQLSFTYEGGGEPYGLKAISAPSDSDNHVLLKAIDSAKECMGEHFKNKPIFLREGGSVPIIADLKTICGLDSLMVGLFTPEDNLHAPDESFHTGVMKNAIPAFEMLFKKIAEVK